jgi:hypothetical protein
MAREAGKFVFAIVGQASKEPKVREIFDGIRELAAPGMDQAESISRAPELLRACAADLAREIQKDFAGE